MTKRVVYIFSVFLLLLPFVARAGRRDSIVDKRVEFLYLFTQEISWPGFSKQENFYVEVVGRDPVFLNNLTDYLSMQTVEGKSISVSNTRDWGLRNTSILPNILYVTESAHHLLPSIVKFFENYPVLIISGRPFREKGWMVSMSQRVSPENQAPIKPGSVWEEWVFSINQENIEKHAKLRVSNYLLRQVGAQERTVANSTETQITPTPHERIASLETEISRFKTALSMRDSAILVQLDVIENLRDTIGSQREMIDSLQQLAYFRLTSANGFLQSEDFSLSSSRSLPQSWLESQESPRIRDVAMDSDWSPEENKGEVKSWLSRNFGWLISVILGLSAISALVYTHPRVRSKILGAKGATQTAGMASAIAANPKDSEMDREERIQNAFLANVSHELRTPLNAIVGLSQYVASTSPGNTEVNESLRIINQNAHGLLRVMDGIITMAMIDAGIMQPNESEVELPELLDKLNRECIELLTNVGKENDIKFVKRISEDLPRIAIMDSDKVQTVLGVLLSNAVNFTTHGEITFACTPQYGENPTIRFYVEDTGPGMTQKQLEKVFTQKKCFDQEDNFNEHAGMGLGLCIAQRLTTIMKSKLTVESIVGIGTKASFSIPLRRPEDLPKST